MSFGREHDDRPAVVGVQHLDKERANLARRAGFRFAGGHSAVGRTGNLGSFRSLVELGGESNDSGKRAYRRQKTYYGNNSHTRPTLLQFQGLSAPLAFVVVHHARNFKIERLRTKGRLGSPETSSLRRYRVELLGGRRRLGSRFPLPRTRHGLVQTWGHGGILRLGLQRTLPVGKGVKFFSKFDSRSLIESGREEGRL